ncbi:uncharacterized protein LOC110450636, partial [Mizuhopecten yessoensis]|uniref:uncharacterized protein LOC110450636 n=1 Tax=Mizuhopecten yessoensis TaxID=6573 RepID=UPI000B45D1A0
TYIFFFCIPDHYVRSCDFDGGNDTCVRCAQGTFLADNTSSQQYNHECVSYPECFPDATRSLYPNYCAGQHVVYCKCDVTRNFCGHDPCKCRYGHCSYSAPLLRVNCGCDRRSTTSTPTTTTTTKITTTTEEMSSIKSTKMPNVSSTPVHSSPQTTKEQTSLTKSRQTTIKPGGDEEDTGLSGGIIAAIVIPIVVLLLLGVAWYVKKRISSSYSQARFNDDGIDSGEDGL